MARRNATVQLDGEVFEMRQLGATEGLAIYSKLLKVLGPMIRGALTDPALLASKGEGDDAGMKVAAIVISGIEQLDTAFLQELATQFAKESKVKMDAGMMVMSAGDIFDQHFAGRYAHLTRWLLAHLRLNFADFLAALGSSGSQKQPAEPSA